MSRLTADPVVGDLRPGRADATTRGARRDALRRLAVILAVQSGAIIAYWTLWAIDHSLVVADPSAEYANFEAAFPLPDALVAAFSLLAARDLWSGRSRGVAFVLLGAGAGLFLGLVDLAYDLQNGIWAQGVNGLVEAVVVVTILVSGTGFALWGGRALGRLADGRPL